MNPITRRDFVALSASTGLTALCGWPVSVRRDAGPTIFWTSAPSESLRTVDDVRSAIRAGRAGRMYAQIRRLVEQDLHKPPLTPSDPLDGRDVASIRNNSPDFIVTNEAGQRMLRAALVAVVEEDGSYRHVAIEQMEALFDRAVWEGWIDKAHLRFGLPADLRTGMLAEAVGLAYDWLRPYLSERERSFVIEGLDRCAIRPFLESMEQNAWWLADLHNWLTTIVGGLGIAGMALKDDHPDSDYLVTYSTKRMEEYLTIYGPRGEFNESVHYANATLRPVSYFQALRYTSGDAANRLAEWPFPETCLWQLYLTLPPGRVAAFGDARPEAKPWTKHIAAVAAASRNPILQWFYLTYADDRAGPIELLWFDETLEPKDPTEMGLPKAGSFPAHGGCIVSRSGWDPYDADCIVYGKAGREENHEHNDAGQICIDGNGERLIIDIGSPKPTYPPDFFDEARYEYYNASVLGHNVLMIDGKEQRYPRRERGVPIAELAKERSGHFLETNFDEVLGASWSMDLTPAYDQEVERITRSVIHLLPGIVAVVDYAELRAPSNVSLRWHTIVPPDLEPDGSFSFVTEASRLIGRIVSRTSPSVIRLKRHQYRDPYSSGRGGVPLEQRREPYIELETTGSVARFLSLFAVGDQNSSLSSWSFDGSDWSIEVDGEGCHVGINGNTLSVSREAGDASLSLKLPGLPGLDG